MSCSRRARWSSLRQACRHSGRRWLKGVAYGGPGGLARFKQKREGKDEFIEGEGERIEHDARSEITSSSSAPGCAAASTRSGQLHILRRPARKYQVTSGVSADGKVPAKDGGGRVRAIIQPKGKTAANRQRRPADPETLRQPAEQG